MDVGVGVGVAVSPTLPLLLGVGVGVGVAVAVAVMVVSDMVGVIPSDTDGVRTIVVVGTKVIVGLISRLTVGVPVNNTPDSVRSGLMLTPLTVGLNLIVTGISL